NVIDGQRVRPIDPRRGLPGREVGGLFEDSVGRVWLGVANTVMTYERGHFSPISNAGGRPLARTGPASAFAEDRNGDVWALTATVSSDERHLLLMRTRRVVGDIAVYAMISSAFFLAPDRQEGIWIGGGFGELVHLRNDEPDVVVRLESPDGPVTGYSLSADSD